MALPSHILTKIRQRKGLATTDTSMDERFNAMSPLEALREVVGWELGDPDLANQLLRWAQACGFELKPDF